MTNAIRIMYTSMFLILTISLIPVSFAVGSLGLEEGRGGGMRAPVARGVMGRFGNGTRRRKKEISNREKNTYSAFLVKKKSTSVRLFIHAKKQKTNQIMQHILEFSVKP